MRLKHLLILLILVSCGNEADFSRFVCDYYASQGISFPKEVKHCVVIPVGGCSSCIASGLREIKMNKPLFSINQKENMVVFTNLSSRKLLYRKMGKRMIDSLYSVVDSTNIYTIDHKNHIYPLVLYLKNGVIVKAESQQPSSGTLSRLIDNILEDSDIKSNKP